jgi:hypothetical protein
MKLIGILCNFRTHLKMIQQVFTFGAHEVKTVAFNQVLLLDTNQVPISKLFFSAGIKIYLKTAESSMGYR